MGLYSGFARDLLFRADPERVHNLALWAIRHGMVRAPTFSSPLLKQSLFGVEFANPLGLAAGFDKNAVALSRWAGLGFGYVEVGTVTWLPQQGNPKPRLFRLPDERALINRMGFNNDGAEEVAWRLARSDTSIPYGVNLGKSKLTTLEEAADDYRHSARAMRLFGSYLVVNVSSPNTPGLRTLQEKGPLAEIIHAIRQEDQDKPLFVKVAPDLEMTALDDVVELAHTEHIAGLIATNTTLARTGIAGNRQEAGGLSGAPLKAQAMHFLKHLYANCDRSIMLIATGGIMDGDDLYDRLAAGATLAQVYTGWVYGGPRMPAQALRRVAERMEQQGYASLAELRGTLT